MIRSAHRSARTARLVVAGAIGATLLAGCSSTTPAASGVQGGAYPGGNAAPGGGAFGDRRPGVVGQIAAVDGRTLQVQGDGAQTAVTWNAKTTFSEDVAGTAAAVRTGSCVQVRSGSGPGSPSAPATAAPSGSAGTGPVGTVTATLVTVLPTTKDGCAAAAFGGRTGFGGRPSEAPSGRPSSRPGGVPGGFARMLNGTVTATDANGFTVRVTAPTSSGSASADRTVTVATGSSTRYTTRKTVSGSAAKVGRCAEAQGSTDSTGAMTATRITLSAPVDGTCSPGFGHRG
ncbi:hypothetical protein FHX74_000753 [Friedmanniella endophytica]|uniref:DUF5666 domain-containing protein n=1 Tax=Microlunatus kandeliicorticis TaxID=1759536 RepID=A0A7W3IQ34_9ACTN|nr:DUF5666 domain-containing protein [Microlunatus kandeliicorticis]MBA8793159.1 hypothetical protein [Microlunatus kandeliicorticis]